MKLIENTSFISKYGHFVSKLSDERFEEVGVYMLFDKSFGLLYVGQGNIKNRLKTHCKNENKKWKYAFYMPVENKENRLSLEAYLIRYGNPKNNRSKPSFRSAMSSLTEKHFYDVFLKVSNIKTEMDRVVDILESDIYDID